MRTLHDAWSSGTAHWVTLTAKQLATFLADAKSRLGDQPVKIRKERSDKNKKRKQPDGEGESRDEDKENENEVPAKVAKKKKTKPKTTPAKSAAKRPRRNMKVATQLPPRSRSVIDTSDEEEA